MASSMTKISSVTVGSGGSSSISFTGIAQTYTDLLLKVSVRSSRADTVSNLTLRFNGSTTSYTNIIIYGDGANAGTYSNNFTTYGHIGTINASNSTASTFSSADIYIANYAGANNKVFIADTVSESNSATAYQVFDSTLLSNTSAITSIELFDPAGNFVEYSTATLYGITKVAGGTGTKATGGTVTTSGGYTYHTFFTSGMFTPTTNISGAEVLIVAGGGAGSTGGGGAGGLRYFSSQSFTSGTAVPAIVGAGGFGVTGNNTSNSGTNSRFGSNSATGGGAGGTGNGIAGGSGGGSGGSASITYTGGAGNSGGYSPVEGYAGGGNAGWYGAPYPTGGGGGAGAVGGSAVGANYPGRGGIGVNTYSAWASATGTGLNGFYAGGGGGSCFNGGGYPGTGGSGGGGQGGTNYQTVTAGQPNTGGGGGGIPNGQTATPRNNGGSGIVIVRYTT